MTDDKSENSIARFNNPMLVAAVDEDSSQRIIRVVTDASEEWTTAKVEVVVKNVVRTSGWLAVFA